MPGGVMLQIGIHYVDVLEFLMGPVKRVSGMSAQLVLPGDNPDVANLILEHENGAISNLTASYASASEYYMMNIYGKEATRLLRPVQRPAASQARRDQGDAGRDREATTRSARSSRSSSHCVREDRKPETDGFWASRNLAVIKAGVRSAREGRAIDVDDIIKSGE